MFSVVGATPATFNDTIDSTLLDNDVGVQWDVANPGCRVARRPSTTTWRFRRFTPLHAHPHGGAKSQGQIATATVTARNSDGNPDPGRSVLYAITGANPARGAVTTGADGTATITLDRRRTPAPTRSRAFIDINGNGVRDARRARADRDRDVDGAAAAAACRASRWW